MPIRTRAAAALFPLPGSLQAFADTPADIGAKIAAQGTTKGARTLYDLSRPGRSRHGASRVSAFAGLDAAYLAKQLRDYRAGTRNNPVMLPMAKNLTEDEILAVSGYYAAMPIPPVSAQPPPSSSTTRRSGYPTP